MNRPLLGFLLGGILGMLDGSTAWFSAPELRSEFAGIILGSATKGVVAGLITGFLVRKTGALAFGAIVGLVVAVALAIPVAYLNATHYENTSYYWKIILPPTLLGAVVGFATVRYGRASGQPARG